MRKTLTLMLLVLAASPLAACKMFWEHDDKPAAVASTTDPTPTGPTDADLVKTDPVATADASKLTSPVKPDAATSVVPAKK